ncbi:MAG: hypothetical protein EOO03_13880, partial [Chitinophagaceae bacterium]
MKKLIPLLCIVTFLFHSMTGFSQKYKTPADTVKLNQEYIGLTSDIADLNAKLSLAQIDLESYQSKSKAADTDASTAASASSDQASKASGGSLRDARIAKRKASKAYGEAKDARSASNKVKEQENKIARYQKDIRKKQERLKKLDAMRTAINAKMFSGSTPH